MKKQTDPAPILEALNPAQKEAVLHEEGPLFVLAGAGSGKTRVITHRIAYLLQRGLPPDSILAITFTNKAAGEMKTRTEQLSGMKSPWISTFHSFCARILRRHIHLLEPYDNSFSIYDTDDGRALLKEILQELDISSSLWKPPAAQAAISRLKNSGELSGEGSYAMVHVRDSLLGKIHHAYTERMQERNAVDFDDLLLLTVRLFDEAPDVVERYREQFRQVLVDEYQDINSLQYRIGNMLTLSHRNLCITGDPDQSIYGWRGADISNILNFQKDYPDARLVTLDKNYRSTQRILNVANALIDHNVERVPKSLWTDGPAGEPVRVYWFEDDRKEASEVASLIQDLRLEGVPPGDIAVFYRINALSRSLEREFIYGNIPYSIVGGIEFFLRKEVKDILAYLRILDNPRDTESVRRIINVPGRGIGKATVDKLLACSRHEGRAFLDLILDDKAKLPVGKRALASLVSFRDLYRGCAAVRKPPVMRLVQTVIESTGYEDYLRESGDAMARERTENLSELVNAAREYDEAYPDGSLTGFLEMVNLLGDVDRWERAEDRVALMSLHSAKGLEFPVVVIVGLEDGILPLLRESDSEPDLEEERRLLYVGITRAKSRLYLTHAANRMRFGRTRNSFPSRFLSELTPPDSPGETEGVESIEIDQDTTDSIHCQRAKERMDDDVHVDAPGGAYYAEDLVDEDPFPVGARVYHDDYGDGEVLRVSGIGRRRTITVAFEEGGELQFNPVHAPLRRIR